MVRPAAAEVGLGDQDAELAAELVAQGVEFLAVGRRVERSVAVRDVEALAHREGDEADARVALGVGLGSR